MVNAASMAVDAAFSLLQFPKWKRGGMLHTLLTNDRQPVMGLPAIERPAPDGAWHRPAPRTIELTPIQFEIPTPSPSCLTPFLKPSAKSLRTISAM
jgi:hypothetical protein